MKVLTISQTEIWVMGERKGLPSIYMSQKGFVDRGHEVYYLSLLPLNNRHLPAREMYEGISIIRVFLPIFIVPANHLHLHRISNKIYWFLFATIGTIKAYRIAKKIHPNVVYGHSLYGAPVAYIIGRSLKIPNITRLFYISLYPFLGRPFSLMRKFDEVLAFKTPCEYMIAVNDGSRTDILAEKLKTPCKKILMFLNGVNFEMYNPNIKKTNILDKFALPKDCVTILSLSRLERWKRVDRIISATPEIKKSIKDFRVVIAGDGSQREELEELSNHLRVGDFVRFIGGVTREGVASLMNVADIFVSLQDGYNMSNSLWEAMVCGKAIVTVDNGEGISKFILDGETGFLLNPNELNTKLPNLLIQLIQDRELRLKLGMKARKFALNNFDPWCKRMEKEVKMIENLVNR